MSHICGRASSEKVSHVFNKESKTTDKKCCSMKTVTADSKYFNHLSTTDGQYKVRRLKTRKQRSQMRGGWKETSKTKSYHHHCHRQNRRDMAHFQNCCHRTSRKNTPISSCVPAPQEPSIITDSRLIGHHGLFNHEVKSIDIERLLSKHGKETEVKNHKFDNQGSNITSDQRQQQQLDLSSGSCKSNLSCKDNFHNLEITKNDNNVPSEKDRESQLTPLADADDVKTLNSQIKRHVISDLEQPHKNWDYEGQIDGFSPNPPPHSSALTADSFDMEHVKQDPEYVSKSISALAVQLCESLHLPLLKRRNLLSKSRKVLLKSLQERHRSSLQENLDEVQQWVQFGMRPTQVIQEQECRVIEEDERLSSEASTKMNTSNIFNWKSSPQPHENLHQTAECLANPVDTPASLLAEYFIPSLSPRFSMDFEQAGSSASGLFDHSPTSYRERKASASDHWEDPFSKSKSEESVLFDSFKDSFMNHTREVRESSCTSQHHFRNIQPFFPHQAQLPDGPSVEPGRFIQEQDPFGTDRYSLAPSFPAHIQHPFQRNYFQPFTQTSTSTTFTSNRTDMMCYPPSHMLETSPAAPSSSFPSPEHWSFPPMRLY